MQKFNSQWKDYLLSTESLSDNSGYVIFQFGHDESCIYNISGKDYPPKRAKPTKHLILTFTQNTDDAIFAPKVHLRL